MSRTSPVRVLMLVASLGAAGCQDYNFNPVGRCIVETGRRQVTLSDISTADVLFVVDDSGSMGGEQAKLAANFKSFITNLDVTNQNRVAAGQVPIDFHVAITTTSVFENKPDDSDPYCSSACPDPAGGTVAGNVCCKTLGSDSNRTMVAPYLTVQKCNGAGDTCAAGECRSDCVGLAGEWACCAPTVPHVPQRTQRVSCTNVGTRCGAINTHYEVNPFCEPGPVTDGQVYPKGSFVRADASNPAILHFEKSLYQCGADAACATAARAQITALQTAFSENVLVGTCGSSQEAGLEAAYRAVDYWRNQPADGREWLHPNSKLVLVFVGDEDDCSSPEDANLGVLLDGVPGNDSCVADASLSPDQQKEKKIADYVSYFTDLPGEEEGVRPVGAAFIVSAKSGTSDVCVDDTCVAGICCDKACTGTDACTSATCGGQAKGTRMLETAAQLRAQSSDVVAGSICDPGFGTILDRIAEIVKPPTGLLLPSQPASEEVTVLRIAAAGSSSTRKTCNGPAPAELTAAQAAGPATAECPHCPYDWWFTASREQLTDAQRDPTAASKYVYINHDTSNCEASPGETYSAEYLGRMPSGGCTGTTPEEADDNCVSALGGRSGDWTCFAGVDGAGVCVPPTNGVVGTCVCGARGSAEGRTASDICPNG